MARRKKHKNESLYVPADKGFWVNDDDPDLKKVWIPLPDPPKNPKDIDGYGLTPKDQKFHHAVMPAKLIELDMNDKLPFQADKWRYLLKNIDDYTEEYRWIEAQWERRRNGYWFYNKGKPTYITGRNYMSVNFWRPAGLRLDYRDRDRRYWHIRSFCDEDEKCLGTVWPKHRREGLTSRATCEMYDIASQESFVKVVTQSLTEKNAVDNVLKMVKLGWKAMPFFFKPAYSGVANPGKSISFEAWHKKHQPDGDVKEMNSEIRTEPSGEFAVDGYEIRFYFGDEAGKTVEANVSERHNVVKETLVRGSKRIGHALYGSTVEEMDARGGANFKIICDQSHYHHDDPKYARNENGQTLSGMYLFFIPADDGLPGFIDEYGYSIRKKAREFLENRRRALLKAGDISGFASERRKYPMQFRECWLTSGKGANFNVKLLSDRIDQIRIDGDTEAVCGDFVWKNGLKDTEVEFIPNPDGRFYVSWMPSPEWRNRYETFPRKGGGFYRSPIHHTTLKTIGGADAFKFKDTKDNNSSLGGGAVFRKRDEALDPDSKPVEDWVTHRFACSYLYRPDNLFEDDGYCEDMLKMCFFYGCMVDHERNVEHIETHFIKRGYEGFLYYNIDPHTGAVGKASGTWSDDTEREKIFASWQIYIKKHIAREQHITFLEQCLNIEDDMGPYDAFVAGGRCLRAVEKDYEIEQRRKDRWGSESSSDNKGLAGPAAPFDTFDV